MNYPACGVGNDRSNSIVRTSLWKQYRQEWLEDWRFLSSQIIDARGIKYLFRTAILVVLWCFPLFDYSANRFISSTNGNQQHTFSEWLFYNHIHKQWLIWDYCCMHAYKEYVSSNKDILIGTYASLHYVELHTVIKQLVTSNDCWMFTTALIKS